MRQLTSSLTVFALLIGIIGLVGFSTAAAPPANPDIEVNCEEQTKQGEPASDTFVCAEEKGGTFTYDISSSPSRLNPITSGDTASSVFISHVLGGFFNDYETLAGGMNDMQAAEMIEFNEAGNVMTARLREGLQFSDGSSVTTEDIAYWYYNVVWNPNLDNQLTGIYSCPSGQAFQLEIVSDRELKFGCPDSDVFRELSTFAMGLDVYSRDMAVEFIDSQGISTNPAIAPGPNGVLDSSASGDDENQRGAVIVPGENGTLDSSASGDDVMIEHATQEFMGLGVDISKLRGLGPYQLTQFQPNTVGRFEPNPNFYEVDSNGTQLPYLNQITVLNVEDANVELSNFLDGTTDTHEPRPSDISVLRSRQAEGGFPLNENLDNGTPQADTEFVIPNYNDQEPNLAAAARNQKVRRALSLAINRVAIVQNVQLGLATPQLTPTPIPGGANANFFTGKNNTCEDLINAGVATADNCSDGTWTVRNGVTLDVTTVPDPDLNSAVTQHLECFVDHQACLEKARSLLDEAGVTDTNGDGVREIPANFSDVIDNSGGPFQTTLATQASSTVRVNAAGVVCDSWAQIGVNCQVAPTAFNTLVGQLFSGDWSGHILIGLTGGGPEPGSVAQVRCGGQFHFYHFKCNPDASEGPQAKTELEAKLEEQFLQGRAAADVETAQQFFTEFVNTFTQGEPFFHTTQGNSLFGFRTDRLCNVDRSQSFDVDVKFRTDIEGQATCVQTQ